MSVKTGADNVTKNTPVNTPRRALVLGCGAVAGGAWTIAALQSLRQQLNWEPGDAELLVGTSVGAVIAALLACGVSLDQLIAAQQTDEVRNAQNEPIWNHRHDSGGALPPWPKWRLTAPALIKKALNREVRPLTGFCGLLPSGQTDMSAFKRLITQAAAPFSAQQYWPDKKLWLMAVDAQTAQRRALGREASDRQAINLADAVCASYAVPGCCPPVDLQGRRYLDGGIVSPVSADLLVNEAIDEVIVLAPMASRQPGKAGGVFNAVERYVRRGMTSIVDREEAILRAAGKRVIRVEPNEDDLRAFGWNLLDPERRQAIFDTALLTTPGSVATACRGD